MTTFIVAFAVFAVSLVIASVRQVGRELDEDQALDTGALEGDLSKYVRELNKNPED